MIDANTVFRSIAPQTPITIHQDQSVRGGYVLTVDNSHELKDEARTQLLTNGFKLYGSSPSLSYSGALSGKIYLPGKFASPSALPLNQNYKITVWEFAPPDLSTYTKHILLTPLTITADGLLFLFAMPVYYLSFPFTAARESW